MSEKEEIAKLAQAIQRRMTEQGKAIEGGWQALFLHLHLGQAHPIQQKEMRVAYYAGAQHLFSCIMSLLEPGAEATDKEMGQLELIHKELEAFYEQKKAEANQ